MKFIFTFIILFTPFTSTLSEEKITVKITSIDVNRGGNLILLIFGEKGFPIHHNNALVVRTIRVLKETTIVTLPAPKYSELAFKVLHDEDSNNKVTKSWTGIWPIEGLGFSNGKRMGSFGPPTFYQTKLARENTLTGVTLQLVYP